MENEPRTAPFVIAVANRKGGTGKTTTAVNLAAAFARMGRRTLLVDLDTQGHAGMGLGIVAEADAPSAHDIFRQGPERLSSAIRHMEQVPGWPDVAPADTRMAHPGGDVPPTLLATALDIVQRRNRYDVVLVDTPPSLDPLMVTALAASDAVVIPFLPHPLAVEGVRQFSRVFFSVRFGSNQRLRNIMLLPVMASPQTRVHRRMIDLLRRDFGDARMAAPIRPDVRLAEAFEARRPIFDYAPSSRGAAHYAALADDLGSRWLSQGLTESV